MYRPRIHTKWEKNQSIQQFSIVLSHLMSQCGLLLSIHFAIFLVSLCCARVRPSRFYQLKRQLLVQMNERISMCVGFLTIHHSGLFYGISFLWAVDVTVTKWFVSCFIWKKFVLHVFFFVHFWESRASVGWKRLNFFMVNIFHGRFEKNGRIFSFRIAQLYGISFEFVDGFCYSTTPTFFRFRSIIFFAVWHSRFITLNIFFFTYEVKTDKEMKLNERPIFFIPNRIDRTSNSSKVHHFFAVWFARVCLRWFSPNRVPWFHV